LFKIHQRKNLFSKLKTKFEFFSRSPSTTIVSNIQNASSPVNLFTNLPGGIFPPNNTNTTANQGQSTSSVINIYIYFS
jgi:hypothetical protein